MSPPKKHCDTHLELLRAIKDGQKDLCIEQKEIVKSMNKLDKKIDLHIQKNAFEHSKSQEMDEEQNMILDKHIEGVLTLKEMHKDYRKEVNARLEHLEKPRKWASNTFKIILGAGTLAGALWALKQVVPWLLGLL